MIFASDLDQTLIYSERFLTDPSLKVRLIEKLDEKPISYMTERALCLLEEINKHMLFIPVTTRTIEQYNRITIFQNELKPKYAITSNGGNIICNGAVDEFWNKKIRMRIEDECISITDILKQFEDIKGSDWILNEKSAEDLFYYFIIDRQKMPTDEWDGFVQWMEHGNWTVSIQGRKLYFVPRAVNKRDAVLYVKSVEERSELFVAGDSLLDLPLVSCTSNCLIPSHGEIYHLAKRLEEGMSFPFTAQTGILASEEILEWVIEQMKIAK
ncbi:HAD family hydrolase [Brevibacillus reuszeri]|uniref:HAD family hydrolase n=1 Tax=Brevibacillus reuszeri TaxID=54915 RepID=UPI00289C38BC|nr:HAD family hydrolase [Brevibacillus reuszeri]